MPLGKPDPQTGEVISASRHYSGKPNPLGSLSVWTCPACGKQNDGQKIEHGCVHCGAGDQRLGKAGGEARGAVSTAPAETAVPRFNGPTGNRGLTPDEADARVLRSSSEGLRDRADSSRAPSMRILRIIEYLILPGESADDTLRRSLIGRMDFPWGTLTGTIVDSVDPRQEDLLSLARRQPGVWMGNPEIRGVAPRVVPYEEASQRVLQQFDDEFQRRPEKHSMMPPPPPDTGPAFSPETRRMAQQIFDIGGYRLCYTLALALQGIAEELQGVMERERFLTQEEALRLANALLQQVPEDWTGEAAPEEAGVAVEADALPPTPPADPDARARAAISRVQAASHVAAVFRERKE